MKIKLCTIKIASSLRLYLVSPSCPAYWSPKMKLPNKLCFRCKIEDQQLLAPWLLPNPTSSTDHQSPPSKLLLILWPFLTNIDNVLHRTTYMTEDTTEKLKSMFITLFVIATKVSSISLLFPYSTLYIWDKMFRKNSDQIHV